MYFKIDLENFKEVIFYSHMILDRTKYQAPTLKIDFKEPSTKNGYREKI